MRQLSAFAAGQGTPLDLSPFTSITIERRSASFMSIDYRTRNPLTVYATHVYQTIND